MLFTLAFTIPYPNVHLQPVYHGPLDMHKALEGGSFVTTFDARPYRFHGTCTYTLLQVGGTLGLGEREQSSHA